MIVVLSPAVLLCDETTAVGVAKIIRIRCCTVLEFRSSALLGFEIMKCVFTKGSFKFVSLVLSLETTTAVPHF